MIFLAHSLGGIVVKKVSLHSTVVTNPLLMRLGCTGYGYCIKSGTVLVVLVLRCPRSNFHGHTSSRVILGAEALHGNRTKPSLPSAIRVPPRATRSVADACNTSGTVQQRLGQEASFMLSRDCASGWHWDGMIDLFGCPHMVAS